MKKVAVDKDSIDSLDSIDSIGTFCIRVYVELSLHQCTGT